jgi:hypothetical protein
MKTEIIKTTTEVKSNINASVIMGGDDASHTSSNNDIINIIFKNEKGSGGEFYKSWGVYFEGQNYKFDTIVLAWGDDGLYGEGWTQLSDAVADIVGGGFESFIDIKNAFRMNADKLKIEMKPLGY